MSKREEFMSKYYDMNKWAEHHLTRAMAFQELYDNEELEVDRLYLKGKINIEVAKGKEALEKAIWYLHRVAESLED